MTVENGQLMMQPNGAPSKLGLLASDTTFFMTTPNVQIEFVKGGNGAVTGLIDRQTNRRFTAARK